MASDLPAITAYAPVLPVSAKPANVASAASSPGTTAGAAAPPQASPVSLLDPSTGLIVLEFFDAKGDETESLPTKKQLDLYRLNETSPNIFQPSIHDDAAPSITRQA